MSPRAVLALAAAAVLAVATPAMSAEDFVFEGRGFGHGVGMSQHGARGAAEAGWDAPRILAHYYRGTALTRQPPRGVRVQLRPSSSSVGIAGSGLSASAPGGANAVPLPERITARARGGVVVIEGDEGGAIAEGRELEVASGSDAPLELDGRRYRGTLVLRAVGARRVQVVNHLDLESYLYGVVPREVPASWPREALRAQAIAARSYAIGQLRPDRGFDVHPDTRSQVYGGRDGEHERTTAAVDATRGLAVTHGGAVATTFFHASSGGHTENVENVWSGSPRPYLVGVPDPHDAGSPHRRWPDPPRFSGEELGDRLGLPAPVTGVAITERGVSPRVRMVRVTMAGGGETVLTGATVRARLGLRDTWFSVNEAPPEAGGRPERGAPPRGVVRYVAYAAAPASAAKARSIARRLRSVGKDVVILRRRVGGRLRHLVVTGHFRALANARAERDDLRARGYRGARVGSAAARRAVRAYLVTAGARPTRRAVRRLAVRVRADGFGARVITRRRSGRRVHLVVTGRYRALARAKAARSELRERGFRGAMVGPAR